LKIGQFLALFARPKGPRGARLLKFTISMCLVPKMLHTKEAGTVSTVIWPPKMDEFIKIF
jgi:hypothetical protein